MISLEVQKTNSQLEIRNPKSREFLSAQSGYQDQALISLFTINKFQALLSLFTSAHSKQRVFILLNVQTFVTIFNKYEGIFKIPQYQVKPVFASIW